MSPGIQCYALDLRELYSHQADRTKFETRWREFARSASDHEAIFQRDGECLLYQTESFLPELADERAPVLFVLGNPASQSVRAGMCFAFEHGARVEHRFWRALRMGGWLSFSDADRGESDVAARNESRRTQLLAGTYQSPFLIGVEVFFSFPSPASAPRWAGVAGLAALFGRRALRSIAEAERRRLAATISRYQQSRGAVIACQRDAYEGLRDPSAVPYSSARARAGALSSASAAGHAVRLFGTLPTRLAHTHAFHEVLRRHREEIIASRLQRA